MGFLKLEKPRPPPKPLPPEVIAGLRCDKCGTEWWPEGGSFSLNDVLQEDWLVLSTSPWPFVEADLYFCPKCKATAVQALARWAKEK